jgi:hypothetical protein
MIEKTITINDKNIVVKKLPLKRYADVLSAFQSLPKHLDLFKGKNEEQLAAILPELISVAYPDVINVVHVVTEVPNEEIENWGLDDLAMVVEAFFEVNNYSFVYQMIKKMTARPIVPTPATTTQLPDKSGFIAQ